MEPPTLGTSGNAVRKIEPLLRSKDLVEFRSEVTCTHPGTAYIAADQVKLKVPSPDSDVSAACSSDHDCLVTSSGWELGYCESASTSLISIFETRGRVGNEMAFLKGAGFL